MGGVRKIVIMSQKHINLLADNSSLGLNWTGVCNMGWKVQELNF